LTRATLALALAFTSCVTVADEYRCDPAHDCVLDGVVGRCESTGHCSVPDASCGTFGYRYHASAGEQAGVCVLAPAPVIESDIDLKESSDHVRSSCAPDGARDVSIELFVTNMQTITIDTVGVQPRAAVVLSLRDGACPAGLAEVAGCRAPTCADTTYNVLAVTLPPGAYCLVVEEADPAAETGKVALRILEGGREAAVIDRPMQSGPQTTCGAPPDPDGASCGPPSTDSAGAAVFVACPGTHVRATVTPDVADNLDIALSLRDGGPRGNELVCTNAATGAGAEMIDTVLQGPTWMVVDRVAGPMPCGGYSISHTFGP
jgi:hypothetical protein